MPSIFLDFERTLSASPNDVRTALRATLHDLGFELTTEQVTRMEARRGHPIMGSLLGSGNVPVQAAVTITPHVGGTDVAVQLADNVASIGRSWGANGAYQAAFAPVQERIDADLGRLDPAAAAGFLPPRFTSKSGTIGVLENTNRVTSDLTGAAVGRVNQLLSGGPRTRVPEAWKKLDTVVLCSDEGAARLELQEMQAHLAVAVLIASQPGSMPPALAAQVEALATRIEGALNGAGTSRYIEIPVADEEEPVVEFLHQQARMREQFAVRTLHRCRTCKFEKITNPDFQRLQKRNSRLRAIGGSVGATFGKSGISPFILVGTLFRFAKLDPDYVCPRCQGTDAEAMVVTFCPQCGTLRTEAALRTCEKCKLDMRTKLSAERLWEPYPDPAATPQPPPPPAAGNGGAANRSGETAALPSPVADAGSALPVPVSAGTPLPVLAAPHSAGPQVAAPRPVHGTLTGTAAGTVPSGVPAGSPEVVVSPPSGAPPPVPPPPPAPAGIAAAPAPVPRRGRAGGKLCSSCGLEFQALYRVVVGPPEAAQTLFVCGRPPACAPRSNQPPVRV